MIHAMSPGGSAGTRSPDIQVLVSTLERTSELICIQQGVRLVNEVKLLDQRVSLAASVYLLENRSAHRHFMVHKIVVTLKLVNCEFL